jgi:hypothetical protein
MTGKHPMSVKPLKADQDSFLLFLEAGFIFNPGLSFNSNP